MIESLVWAVLLVLVLVVLGLSIFLLRRLDNVSTLVNSLISQQESAQLQFHEKAHNGFLGLENSLMQLVNQRQDKIEQNFNIKLDRLQRLVMKSMLDYKESQRNMFEELLQLQVQHFSKQREQEKHNMMLLHKQAQVHNSALTDSIGELKLALLKELQLGSDKLSKRIEEYLHRLTGMVEKRLSDGFDKSTRTFNAIIERLAMIDSAQKKITELSSNVVSLQEVLNDKRSRGAFGEVQLTALIKNVLPKQNYAIQHRLSNNRIVDCMLFLPEPTGDIGIDAKFPLENYQQMIDSNYSRVEQYQAKKQFKLDVKKHIDDIANKYIIANETSSGAIMFVPAEAIFAEIHGSHPDLVAYAHKKRVWIASPTTLMAILTTASAVVKDEATRKQVHIIQEHLGYLASDFSRFQKRIDNLSMHMGKVNQDVQQVAVSANKISNRFNKIENVELEHATPEKIPNQQGFELEPS